MKPSNNLLKTTPEGSTTVRILAEEGRQYLLYLNNSKQADRINSEPVREVVNRFEISFELPAGNYKGQWINPVTGQRTNFLITKHDGGDLSS